MIGQYSVHGWIHKGRRQPYKIEEYVYAHDYESAEKKIIDIIGEYDVVIESINSICLTNDLTEEDISNMRLPTRCGLANESRFRYSLAKYVK